MASVLDRLKIQPENKLSAQLSREERQKKLKLHEAARDRVPEGTLDHPEEVSDEMIEEALQQDDVDKGNYLRNPESQMFSTEDLRKTLKIMNQGLATYKTIKQIPFKVLVEMLKIGGAGLGISAYR